MEDGKSVTDGWESYRREALVGMPDELVKLIQVSFFSGAAVLARIIARIMEGCAREDQGLAAAVAGTLEAITESKNSLDSLVLEHLGNRGNRRPD